MTTQRIERWRMTVLGVVVGLAVVGLGFLEVIVAQRAPFDLPQSAVKSANAALTNAGHTRWATHLRRVEAALTQNDVGGAERAWHDAYGAALGSRRWDALLEVGHASLQIGAAANRRKPAEPGARTLYLAALFRAWQQGSLDGVLQATKAFYALGDHEVAEHGLRIAARLAGQTREAQAFEKARTLKERWAAARLMAESAVGGP